MLPVMSFIGRHNSGKTTVLQEVIRYFSGHGYRVGIIKHSSHDFSVDVPDSDSFRLAQAGARSVAVSSSSRFAFYKQVEIDTPLTELCRLFQDDVDIIFVEGFKQGDQPKIEVARRGISDQLILPRNLVALVTDFSVSAPPVPLFGFDEIEPLCRFIHDYVMAAD